jgi:glycosyltransferase involved in cell wall biosynthesis
MRILHISTRLILGGSQENTVLSCEGQSRRAHDVHLAFGPIYGPEGSLLDRVSAFRTNDGRTITTHTVPHLVREISPRADRRALQELKALITSLNPDIVHTHSSKAGILGRAAAWAVFRATTHGSARVVLPGDAPHRPAIIHTIHGPPFMPLDHGGTGVPPVSSAPLRRLKTRASNYLYTLAERFAARRCHLIISVAGAMTREYLRRGIGQPDQYLTVRSGMETAPFLATGPHTRRQVRARLGLADSDLVIGTVARLAEHKGHDDLLTALAPDLRAHPTWKLLWVGDGWWHDRLFARARDMGLGIAERGIAFPGDAAVRDNTRTSASSRRETPSESSPGKAMPREPQVILTGLLPPEQIPGTISAMDILAHPSYREGLPRTVPQALLCGIPPIAYDVDGTGEVCRDMQTGRLVRLGDIAGLRDGIRWLIDHPDQRRDMAARGREECREAFSAEHMVAELEKVYARALAMAR